MINRKQYTIANALSIDLEDWFNVCNMQQFIHHDKWSDCELRVAKSTEVVLDLLKKHNVNATFFVLGWIAEKLPNLISTIEDYGHEIATHGYAHIPLTKLSPFEFEEDLKRALDVTQRCVKNKIIGFRAPSFSITQHTIWALDILPKYGLIYDSSIYPMGFHPEYGIYNAKMTVYRHSEELIEVPLSCVKLLSTRIPFGGGGYFRIYPYLLTKFLIRRINNQMRPVIFYFHPWEIDNNQPRVDLPWEKKFRHYYGINGNLQKLENLLKDFTFATIKELLHEQTNY